MVGAGRGNRPEPRRGDALNRLGRDEIGAGGQAPGDREGQAAEEHQPDPGQRGERLGAKRRQPARHQRAPGRLA